MLKNKCKALDTTFIIKEHARINPMGCMLKVIKQMKTMTLKPKFPKIYIGNFQRIHVLCWVNFRTVSQRQVAGERETALHCRRVANS